MDLRVPGSSWFDWLLLDQNVMETSRRDHATQGEPTQADVDDAIDAMRAGHIEFVVLDSGDGTFVQAAGQGDAGYQLECWAGGEPAAARSDASIDDVRAAMAAYLGGDPTASMAPAPGAPGGEARAGKKRRWFGRG